MFDPIVAYFYVWMAVTTFAGYTIAEAPWALGGWVLAIAADLILAALLWPSVFAMWPMFDAAGAAWVVYWLHGKGGPPGGAA